MINQLESMLRLQDEMNTKVNANWRLENFAWYRAIWVECGELMDHYGWKWWKHQEPDLDQVKLELIDIWHFGLSLSLLNQQSADELYEHILHAGKHSEIHDFRESLEEFTAYTLNRKSFSVPLFMELMSAVEMDFDELYRSYMGKNVLNRFRQDNGYKEGTYQKTWGGREDNEHLVDLLRALKSDDPEFSEKLYKGLTTRYQRLQEPA